MGRRRQRELSDMSLLELIVESTALDYVAETLCSTCLRNIQDAHQADLALRAKLADLEGHHPDCECVDCMDEADRPSPTGPLDAF